MIKDFRDKETKAIFEGADASASAAKKARKRLPTQLWEKARAKLDAIDAATELKSLDTPSNHLEALAGDRHGEYSIWVNTQYRICFEWDGGDAYNVQVIDYHD